MARVVTSDNVTCTKNGQVCKECDEVYYCVQLPGNKWLSQYMFDCPASTPCLASIGNCSSLVNSNCSVTVEGFIFQCFQTGIFPDPYDCTVYHMCTPAGSEFVELKLKCDSGFAYNSLTTKCSIPITNGTCSTISPSCSKVGNTGPDPQNPSLYYVCLTYKDPVTSQNSIIPAILSCPNDQLFDGASSCTNSINTNTTSTITTSTTTSSSATTSTATTEPTPTADYGLTVDGRCKALGYFPLADDCIGFNYCYIVSYPPQRRNCLYKMYFDPKTHICVDFKCSDLN